MLNEQRRQELFAKLGRESSFASVEERNEWIREEQRLHNNQITFVCMYSHLVNIHRLENSQI